MNIFPMVIGILCIGYGLFTLIIRIKSPKKFGKLEAMKKKFGEKAGIAIHVTAYTVVPLLLGTALLICGILGISIF